LTYYNAVLGGAWIVNGPASITYASSAYWGIGTSNAGLAYPGAFTAPRNGTDANSQQYTGVLGMGMLGTWGVIDYDTNTTHLSYNSVDLGRLTATTANITYSTNTGMTLFADTNGAEGISQACFETMALYSATQASRVAMAQWLMTQGGYSFPFAPNTSDGFVMSGVYSVWNSIPTASAYGGFVGIGPDAYGLTWWQQTGGYTWPSAARATNINNGTTMWRFQVRPGDSDVDITSAERSEIQINNGNRAGDTVPGNSFSFAAQFQFEAYTNQTGDWCDVGQIHYENVTAGASSPDIFSIDCRNNNLQILTQKTVGGTATTTNCGSPVALVQGTVYAVVGTGFWSTSHTADTLTVNLGTNGTTLATVCNTSGALWDNDVGAYQKAGLYRGFPHSNAGNLILRVMNIQWNPTTANAYSAQITTQRPLPTH
jgi:hypothetical protein